jgi:hypothetical protein
VKVIVCIKQVPDTTNIYEGTNQIQREVIALHMIKESVRSSKK